jgi:1,2-diacylglycerol 3-beta-galactosyltransferase
VSKAGPGTIAESAAVGLPVMITSFLPGQEAGNVDIVLDGGFGAFQQKPRKCAETIASWLKDESLLDDMAKKSALVGHPHAAADIVKDIGKTTEEYLRDTKI